MSDIFNKSIPYGDADIASAMQYLNKNISWLNPDQKKSLLEKHIESSQRQLTPFQISESFSLTKLVQRLMSVGGSEVGILYSALIKGDIPSFGQNLTKFTLQQAGIIAGLSATDVMSRGSTIESLIERAYLFNQHLIERGFDPSLSGDLSAISNAELGDEVRFHIMQPNGKQILNAIELLKNKEADYQTFINDQKNDPFLEGVNPMTLFADFRASFNNHMDELSADRSLTYEITNDDQSHPLRVGFSPDVTTFVVQKGLLKKIIIPDFKYSEPHAGVLDDHYKAQLHHYVMVLREFAKTQELETGLDPLDNIDMEINNHHFSPTTHRFKVIERGAPDETIIHQLKECLNVFHRVINNVASGDESESSHVIDSFDAISTLADFKRIDAAVKNKLEAHEVINFIKADEEQPESILIGNDSHEAKASIAKIAALALAEKQTRKAKEEVINKLMEKGFVQNTLNNGKLSIALDEGRLEFKKTLSSVITRNVLSEIRDIDPGLIRSMINTDSLEHILKGLIHHPIHPTPNDPQAILEMVDFIAKKGFIDVDIPSLTKHINQSVLSQKDESTFYDLVNQYGEIKLSLSTKKNAGGEMIAALIDSASPKATTFVEGLGSFIDEQANHQNKEPKKKNEVKSDANKGLLKP